MKKYELTTETNSEGLFRIKAVRDIPAVEVKAGDLGGFIESEKNLDHFGNSWVSDNARVFGSARVFGNSWVSGDARVSDNARVFGDALVSDSAQVSGDARVEKRSDVVWMSNVGSEGGTLTIFKTEKGVGVTRGCFGGTYDEFIEKVKKHMGITNTVVSISP